MSDTLQPDFPKDLKLLQGILPFNAWKPALMIKQTAEASWSPTGSDYDLPVTALELCSGVTSSDSLERQALHAPCERRRQRRTRHAAPCVEQAQITDGGKDHMLYSWPVSGSPLYWAMRDSLERQALQN